MPITNASADTTAAPPVAAPPRPTFHGLPLPLTGREAPNAVSAALVAHLNDARATPLYAMADDWAAAIRHLPGEYVFRVQRGSNQVEVWKVAIAGDRLRPIRARPLVLTLFASGEVGGERNFNTVLAAHATATRVERERAAVERARVEAVSLAVRTRLNQALAEVPGGQRLSEFAVEWCGAGWRVRAEITPSGSHADLTGCTAQVTISRGRYDTVAYDVHPTRIEEATRLACGFSATIVTLMAVEAAQG